MPGDAVHLPSVFLRRMPDRGLGGQGQQFSILEEGQGAGDAGPAAGRLAFRRLPQQGLRNGGVDVGAATGGFFLDSIRLLGGPVHQVVEEAGQVGPLTETGGIGEEGQQVFPELAEGGPLMPAQQGAAFINDAQDGGAEG